MTARNDYDETAETQPARTGGTGERSSLLSGGYAPLSGSGGYVDSFLHYLTPHWRTCAIIYRYQDSPSLEFNNATTTRGAEGFSTVAEPFPSYGEDDSSEWVWSNAKSEGKSQKKTKNGDDLLIDFGENKAKKSTQAAPKVKSAEEEAWDMLNSWISSRFVFAICFRIFKMVLAFSYYISFAIPALVKFSLIRLPF